MKIYSWNVNGIRATLKKEVKTGESFIQWLENSGIDILCLQETKVDTSDVPKELLSIKNYKAVYASGIKKGYSGVAVYYKTGKGIIEPHITIGLGIDKFDNEGRTIVIQYPEFILINVYIPNGKKNEERLAFKMDFSNALQDYCLNLLKEKKHVIVTGDINTAHQEIDLANPKPNSKFSGFLPAEREWLTNFLNLGFIDTFRFQHGDEIKYSWWSSRLNARERNLGWRIDYFFIDSGLKNKLIGADIHNDIFGADHCPISIELKF
jgi:exodeoxyribonuclease-3